MPLFIPNRPSSPFASTRNRRGQSGQEGTRPSGADYLKMFPLGLNASRPGRGAGPANQRRQPERQMQAPVAKPEYTMAPPQMRGNAGSQTMRNTIGQTLPQFLDTQGGMSPPRHHGATNKPESTQAQPVNHEQAAQFFRRANKSLPDGVRYEPLDDATMRLLRENGHLPPALEPPATGQQMQTPPLPQQQSPMPVQAAQSHSPLPAATPAVPHHTPMMPAPQPFAITPDSQSIAKIIESLVQDERNAHIFYSNLAKIAQGQPMEPALTDIATDSSMYSIKFSQMLSKQFGNNFEPAEKEINTGLGFKESLALALEEEHKSLRALTELLEKVANPETEKAIQRVINKKIVNYSQLERLYTHP